MALETKSRTQRRGPALVTVLAVLFLTFLDTTIVSVTLGSMQYDLGAGVIPLQWVVNAYSLVFACLMLIAGSLGDRIGRRTVMAVGIAIFCLGSVVCALAPGIGWVIAGRAVMGLGAAASEPGTLSVIRHLYPERSERARALAGWAAVSGLSLAIGPVLGGLFVSLGGWRDVFWFNLALGVVALVSTGRFVPDSADPQPGRLDTGGFALGAVALGALIFAGITGEQYGYSTGWIVTLFVVSAVAFAAFLIVERRVRSPMLELRYLRDATVGSALFTAFAAYFGIFSIFFLTALYLDVLVGYGGAELAGVFAPMAVAIVLGSALSGRWVARAGPRLAMITGCLLSAAGILATRSLLVASPSYRGLMVALAVAGLGFGIVVVPLTAAVLGHVPAERSGMAASATNTARQLGSVVGVAALGAIVNGFVTRDFTATLRARGAGQDTIDYIVGLIQTGGSEARNIDLAHPPEIIKSLVDAAAQAFRTGMHVALFVAAGLILVAAAVAALVPKAAMAPSSELG